MHLVPIRLYTFTLYLEAPNMIVHKFSTDIKGIKLRF